MGARPLRIALISSPVTPLGPAQLGGSQAVISDLAQGLSARGHEVTVCCAAGSEIPGVHLLEFEVPAAAARAALVLPSGPAPPPVAEVDGAFAEMFQAVDRLGVDVIGQHAFDVAAFELSRGRAVVHTLHLPPIVPAVVEAVRSIEAARLVAVSEASRAGWTEAGVVVGRVIRNGLRPQPVAGATVKRMALAAGRLSPEKGFEDAIKAARVAGIPITVAGAPYQPGYVVDLDGATYVGSLPRPELRRLMAESAVFLCPVRWEEPFGLAAAEAQLGGCPVAGYRRGALPEVVEEGVSGILVEAGDVGALAAAIQTCLELDRERVRDSGIRRFGIDRMVDAYEAAYREMAR